MGNFKDENGNAEKLANGNPQKFHESKTEKAERFKSLYIVYFTLFLQSLGLAIAMTGIWPYLNKLDPSSTKGFYSIIVAANPLGQFIFSPLIGFWTNKSTSIRVPIIASLVIFMISNALYTSLDLIEDGVKYWMLIIRFFTGVASANIAVGRSYISAATKVDERTHALSMASLAQVTGFIVGPLLQALFTTIGDGFQLPGGMMFSMYTAPGWVNVLFGAANIIILMPHFFQDHNIAVREQMFIQGKESAKETWKSVKLDQGIIWSLIFSYFIVAFNLVILESLATPLTMDQFAFSRKETLKWNGILVGIGALVSCIIFGLLPRVSKMYKEIDILIWAGLFVAVLGKILYIPYRNDSPKLAVDREYMDANGTICYYEDDHPEVLGCPILTQPWCADQPALGIPEFVIGYFLGVIGYPIGVTLIQSLFSKTLGARPQGTWMGIMLASGSMSRIVGPLIVVGSYTSFGTGWTFGWITIFMMIPIALLYVLRHRLSLETPKNLDLDMANNNPQSA
ncbi:hypothetical protein ACKWTF_004128 [Chironomus riparius]